MKTDGKGENIKKPIVIRQWSERNQELQQRWRQKAEFVFVVVNGKADGLRMAVDGTVI